LAPPHKSSLLARIAHIHQVIVFILVPASRSRNIETVKADLIVRIKLFWLFRLSWILVLVRERRKGGGSGFRDISFSILLPELSDCLEGCCLPLPRLI